jgi:multiple sugar transport system substrate-binding protein
MASSRIDRRTFLQRAAVGAAALPAMGALTSARSTAAPAAQAVELEFWSPANDPASAPVITSLTDDFNMTIGAEKGIHVNLRIKPVPDNDDYTQYTTAMTSSGSPDVVMTYNYPPVITWAANGFIKPLDQYAEAAGIKEEDYFPFTWSMVNFAGHIWGLLQEFDFREFFTNTAIHSGPPPKTIDELDTMAAEYTKFDESGNLVQAGLIPWLGFNGLLWNDLWGGQFYDTDARKWTIDKPENAQFLHWFLKYVDLFQGREQSDALESSVPQSFGDLFEYGKVAFALEGEWVPAEMKAQGLDVQYTVTHSPTAPEVPYGTATVAGGNPFLLPTNAKHPEEAAVFIQYMGSKDGSLKWCVPAQNLPPVKDAALDPSFLQQVPALKSWIDAMETGHLIPPIPSPQSALFEQLTNNMIDEVTYKQKSPEDALSEVAQKVADEVARFQQAHPDWEGE